MKKIGSYTNSKKATVDLPYGTFSNETKSGANDGTPILAEHMQDLYYSFYQVLQLAGELPNGELEDGNLKKQFIQALGKIGILKYAETTVYSKGNIVISSIDGAVSLYKSLINENAAPLNDEHSWKLLLTIEADNKINFYVDTNIGGGSSNFPVFCFNSGPVDTNGEPALLTLENNIITQHAPAVCTTAAGETYQVSSDVSLDVSGLTDGDYNIFYNPKTSGLEIYNNTIYYQKTEPADWNINDIWVDTSVMPYVSKIKKSASEIIQAEIVPNAVITLIRGAA